MLPQGLDLDPDLNHLTEQHMYRPYVYRGQTVKPVWLTHQYAQQINTRAHARH
jgi:hypothetical protein